MFIIYLAQNGTKHCQTRMTNKVKWTIVFWSTVQGLASTKISQKHCTWNDDVFNKKICAVPKREFKNLVCCWKNQLLLQFVLIPPTKVPNCNLGPVFLPTWCLLQNTQLELIVPPPPPSSILKLGWLKKHITGTTRTIQSAFHWNPTKSEKTTKINYNTSG